MLASALSAHRRSAALLAAVAVMVLPGGSLIVGVFWLYRHFRGVAQGNRPALIAARARSKLM